MKPVAIARIARKLSRTSLPRAEVTTTRWKVAAYVLAVLVLTLADVGANQRRSIQLLLAENSHLRQRYAISCEQTEGVKPEMRWSFTWECLRYRHFLRSALIAGSREN